MQNLFTADIIDIIGTNHRTEWVEIDSAAELWDILEMQILNGRFIQMQNGKLTMIAKDKIVSITISQMT